MSARKDSRPYGGAVPADTGWLVVQTKRHKERAVQAALAREDIPTYLPLLRQWPRPAVGGEVGPMFRDGDGGSPRYARGCGFAMQDADPRGAGAALPGGASCSGPAGPNAKNSPHSLLWARPTMGMDR